MSHEEEYEQRREIARRLSGDDTDLLAMSEAFQNPIVRGVARLLGIDVSRLDKPIEDIDRLLRGVDESLKRLSPLGWAVYSGVPDAYSDAAALAASGASSEEVDALLTDALSTESRLRITFSHVGSLAGQHAPTAEILWDREKLLRKALGFHLAEEYEAAILVVLSQIDGLASDVVGRKGFFSNSAKVFVDDATLAGMPDSLSAVFRVINRDHASTKLSGELRRHAVIHGRELRYGTKTNSVKAFVLLGATIEWLKPRALELASERQAAEEGRWAGSDEVDERGRRRDRRGFDQASAAMNASSRTTDGT
jgi:hypothetical protein